MYSGLARAALGRIEEAAESFQEAVRLNPSLGEARLGLARVLSQSGKNARARALLEEVLDKDPSRVGAAHNELGLITFREGDLRAAVRHFEAAVAAEPNHRQSNYNLWMLYRRLGDAERADAARSRFMALEDNDSAELRSLSRTRPEPPEPPR